MVKPPKGPHKQVKLNVRVPPNLKEDWMGKLDDGETLKDLVVRAVNRELNNEYVHQDHVPDPIEFEDWGLDAVENRLTGIESQLEEVAADINEVVLADAASEKNARKELTHRELIDLAEKQHNYIPQVTNENEIINQELPVGMEPKNRAPITGLTEDLTLAVHEWNINEDEELDYDIDMDMSEYDLDFTRIDVHQALMYLKNSSTSNIHSILDKDGRRRWFEIV